MESVIIAIGSNKGDRYKRIQAAGQFLAQLSKQGIAKSSIYLTEPVGPSTRYFLNAAVEISTDLAPEELIGLLKKYENEHGRHSNHSRWSARTIDLDVIAFGDLVIRMDSLIIPHADYNKRVFVLMPLRDLHPDWKDPETHIGIKQMFDEADDLQVKKTDLGW